MTSVTSKVNNYNISNVKDEDDVFIVTKKGGNSTAKMKVIIFNESIIDKLDEYDRKRLAEGSTWIAKFKKFILPDGYK